VVQPRFQCARHPRAVVHRHALAVPTIDANLHHRTVLRPTPPELDEIETDSVKLSSYNSFQRFVHVVSSRKAKSDENKKMWGASPTFRSRSNPAQQLQGTRDDTERQLCV
jgi:hypothetical protein